MHAATMRLGESFDCAYWPKNPFAGIVLLATLSFLAWKLTT